MSDDKAMAKVVAKAVAKAVAKILKPASASAEPTPAAPAEPEKGGWFATDEEREALAAEARDGLVTIRLPTQQSHYLPGGEPRIGSGSTQHDPRFSGEHGF
jgi:hypothetical protein